jgi:glycosyltransferase involved in cell wall biosynthesis
MFYSLIIPCYNEKKTITKVLDKATNLVDEIIVVNDASTDTSSKILYDRQDITLIENKKRMGQEKSIENGIKTSKGDIIITMDADFEHNPEDIPRFKKYLVENDFDLVIGKRKNIPRKGEIELNKIFEEKYKITDVMNGFRIFKKEMFNEIGFYYKNGFYGLSFLIEALKYYKVGQIDLSETKRRQNARIGDNNQIEKQLRDIIKYARKRLMENEK